MPAMFFAFRTDRSPKSGQPSADHENWYKVVVIRAGEYHHRLPVTRSAGCVEDRHRVGLERLHARLQVELDLRLAAAVLPEGADVDRVLVAVLRLAGR